MYLYCCGNFILCVFVKSFRCSVLQFSGNLNIVVPVNPGTVSTLDPLIFDIPNINSGDALSGLDVPGGMDRGDADDAQGDLISVSDGSEVADGLSGGTDGNGIFVGASPSDSTPTTSQPPGGGCR